LGVPAGETLNSSFTLYPSRKGQRDAADARGYPPALDGAVDHRRAQSGKAVPSRAVSRGVFGSYVRNEQGTESDLDILVELDEPLGWDIVDLKEDLERSLGLPVDLALSGGITRRPRLMQAVDAEAVYL